MGYRFKVGDRVRVKIQGPEGYNRTPIYIRGKRGVVEVIHGSFIDAGQLGYGKAENHLPLYGVAFNLAAVRGRDPTSCKDTLVVDLFEDWLEGPDDTPVRRHIEKDKHQQDYYERRVMALNGLLVSKGIIALDESRRGVQEADMPVFEAASALLYSPSSREDSEEGAQG